MTTVMILHEVDLLRGALAAVLSHETDLDVTAQLSPHDDVAAAVRRGRPDVLVLHAPRWDTNTAELAQDLSRQAPDCAVLLVAPRHTPESLRAGMDANIRGFLDTDVTPQALVESVRRLAGGERAIEPRLLATALREDDNPLTLRQRDVLRLAGEGLTARDIGRRLYLAPGTVRNYLSTAIRRAGGRSLLEARARAKKSGWL